MNDEGIQSVITRKHIAIVIVALFLLVAAWFVFTITRSGWLEISAASNAPSGSTVNVEIYRGSPGETPQKLSFKAGETKKVFLRKGTIRVDASAANIKSVEVVAIKALSTTKLTAPQGELRAIHKLGSNVTCPSLVGGKLYSYNCRGEGQVYQHNPLDSSTLDTRKLLFDETSFTSMSPLKKGAIGATFSYDDSLVNALDYANLEAVELQRVYQSQEVTNLLRDEHPSVITSSDPGKSQFLLVFMRSNKAFLYDDVNDTEPVTLKLPKNATTNDDFGLTTFSFYEDQIVVYAGATDPTDVLDEEPAPPSERQKTYDNNIYEFDLAGNLTKTINLPKDLLSISTTKVSDTTYILSQNSGEDFYHYDGKNFTKTYRFEGAEEPLVISGKAYMVVKGTLYEFTSKANGLFSLRSVFSSPKVSVNSLYRHENGIIFTAVAKRGEPPMPMDAYQLLDEQQTTKLVEESVDFDRLKNIAIRYDYDDDQIIFNLRSTGYGFDYETVRSRMEAKLQELGMDTGGRRVELYPLN